MLKGWAMLADECPNSSCYGIPLVRPPKVGSEKDPRKECVICGNVYVDERGPYGESRLVVLQSTTTRDNSGTDAPTVSSQYTALPSVSVPVSDKGKGKDTAQPASHWPPSPSNAPVQASAAYPMPLVATTTSTSSALAASAQSLELTLTSLSDRLKMLASSPVVDPSLIGQTADAIAKVAQALAQVKQLQWSENHAYAA